MKVTDLMSKIEYDVDMIIERPYIDSDGDMDYKIVAQDCYDKTKTFGMTEEIFEEEIEDFYIHKDCVNVCLHKETDGTKLHFI